MNLSGYNKFNEIIIKLVFLIIVSFYKIKYLFNRDNNKENNLWLVGENQGACLMENAYWFYKFCRFKYPDLNVYFVMNKHSPFYTRESFYDPNVLQYGSQEHALIFINSTLCFYTHTYKDLAYRRIFELFGKRKQLIYLHHGVLGFKKFDDFYKKNKNIMELFTVGSYLEKDILIHQEGVDKNKVKVTGYCRYDHLYNDVIKTPRQLVFMPTHRNYISGNLLGSTFFSHLLSFLNNRSFIQILINNNLILKVYLHKELQLYSKQITVDNDNIKIIFYGEESVQKLIRESSLMITDYSSVSWDFFYLGKPVVFYRYDIEEYMKGRDSYINLYDEIIGDVAFNENTLIDIISDYIKCNFVMKQVFLKYRREIIPNLDNRNCERVYQEVISL